MKQTILALWLLFFVALPIIGSGTEDDPYRPDLPPILLKLRAIKISAHIPSNPDGTPKFANAIVWIPDRIPVPPGVTALDTTTVLTIIKSRDATADLTNMEKAQ